jgi:glycosyltransferase involved in cell wall biosynthesis
MSLPKISIVTPSYHQAQFIEQTIQSVLAQDYPNLEYIIVDGASQDGSVDIIRKYESQLAWWVSEPDHGQSEACNKGWKRATGDIIGWLNSDDLFLPGTLHKIVQAFEQMPEMGLVFGDVLSMDAEGNIFNVMQFGDWGLDDLMAFNIISQPGVFMRREILEKAGYLDADMHFLMDHHLWLKMAQLAPMKYLPGALAAARYHAAAKNVGAGARYGKDAYRIVDWMDGQPMLAEKMKYLSKKVWAGAHRINARYLLDGGEGWPALKAYWACLKTYPPTALPEWHRMLYAGLAAMGLQKLKPLFYDTRLALRKRSRPGTYQNIAEILKKKVS